MQEANTLIGARNDASHPYSYYAACLYNPLKWIVQLLTFTLAKFRRQHWISLTILSNNDLVHVHYSTCF